MSEDEPGTGPYEREDGVVGPGPGPGPRPGPGADDRDPIPTDLREGGDDVAGGDGDGGGNDDGGTDGNGDAADPYAPEPRSAPIEPETPSIEGTAFVLLGAAATVLVMLRMGAILGA